MRNKNNSVLVRVIARLSLERVELVRVVKREHRLECKDIPFCAIENQDSTWKVLQRLEKAHKCSLKSLRTT